jgi:hypothetical protein
VSEQACFMCDTSILEPGQRCATGQPICDRHRDELTGNMRPPTARETDLAAAQETIAELTAEVERLTKREAEAIEGLAFMQGIEDAALSANDECIALRSQLAARDAEVAELRAAMTELLSSHDNLYLCVFGEQSDPTADIAAKPARALLASQPEQQGDE